MTDISGNPIPDKGGRRWKYAAPTQRTLITQFVSAVQRPSSSTADSHTHQGTSMHSTSSSDPAFSSASF
eukprot:4528331-Pleurochrysis_carterae.AAC.1